MGGEGFNEAPRQAGARQERRGIEAPRPRKSANDLSMVRRRDGTMCEIPADDGCVGLFGPCGLLQSEFACH